MVSAQRFREAARIGRTKLNKESLQHGKSIISVKFDMAMRHYTKFNNVPVLYKRPRNNKFKCTIWT